MKPSVNTVFLSVLYMWCLVSVSGECPCPGMDETSCNKQCDINTCWAQAMGQNHEQRCLIGGDMCVSNPAVLTELLTDCNLNQLPQSNRKKRTIYNFDEFVENKWPGSTIPYQFLHEGFSEYDKTVIRDGLTKWTENSCLTFVEEETPPDAPHLGFQTGTDCISFTAMGENNLPQLIFLRPSCFFVPGVVWVEIGHAIGLWHEHQRPDRDQYVKVNTENIQADEVGNFLLLPDRIVNTYSHQYDYGSIMHFEHWSYSANELPTVEPVDPLYLKTIGQRVEPSFWDVRKINQAYCPDSCVGQTVVCENGGYQNPTACNRCICPDSYGGDYCTELAPSTPTYARLQTNGEFNCKSSLAGIDYSGQISITRNNRVCQAWSSNTPHIPRYNEDRYFPLDGSTAAASNYCRNPDADSRGPWCYTTDPNKRWEYCDIPLCQTTANLEVGSCGGTITITDDNDATAFIESPGYGNGGYDLFRECYWQIKVSPGYRIQLQFYENEENDVPFEVFCRRNVAYHWVEVRYKDDLSYTGPRFCGTSMPELPDGKLTSSGSEMRIIFKSNYDNENSADAGTDPGERAGFKMKLQRVSEVCAGSGNCFNGGTCMPTTDGLSYTCTCRPGFTGNTCSESLACGACDMAAGDSQDPCVTPAVGRECSWVLEEGCRNHGYCMYARNHPRAGQCKLRNGVIHRWCQLWDYRCVNVTVEKPYCCDNAKLFYQSSWDCEPTCKAVGWGDWEQCCGGCPQIRKQYDVLSYHHAMKQVCIGEQERVCTDPGMSNSQPSCTRVEHRRRCRWFFWCRTERVEVSYCCPGYTLSSDKQMCQADIQIDFDP